MKCNENDRMLIKINYFKYVQGHEILVCRESAKCSRWCTFFSKYQMYQIMINCFVIPYKIDFKTSLGELALQICSINKFPCKHPNSAH